LLVGEFEDAPVQLRLREILIPAAFQIAPNLCFAQLQLSSELARCELRATGLTAAVDQ
jgi:hypothetical protein